LPWHTVHKSGSHRSHPLISEHAESCPVNPHAFYHHQQLAELKRLSS
ncbi:hypothetical protein T01_6054, partial [Trichinella spiralis]